MIENIRRVVAQFLRGGTNHVLDFLLFNTARGIHAGRLIESAAEICTKYNIAAMLLFCLSRFVCTFY